MTSSYLHFLNLEYWFCIIYSLLGGKCAALTRGGGSSTGNAAPTTGVTGAGFGVDAGTGSTGSTTAGALTHAPGGLLDAIGAGFVSAGEAIWGAVGAPLSALWHVYSTLAYTVSGLLFIGLVAVLVGLATIRFREHTLYGRLSPEPPGSHRMGSRWQGLLDRAMSADPKEWRQGILEADALLGELLGNLGYPGEGTAEKLRGITDGAFVTLPAAWEAHRVKNFVVSGGSDFILTQREAFRVMKLYEQVFEEFKFV